MTRRIVFVLILVFSIVVGAVEYRRTIEERIEIQQDGSALITRKEYLPASELSKIYVTHYREMSAPSSLAARISELQQEYINEIAKGYYFLYNTAPTLVQNGMSVTIDGAGNYTCVLQLRANGFVTAKGGNFAISRKMFGDETLAEKLIPKYFEYEIDARIFESIFLKSGRDTIVTEKTTVVVLPAGSQIQQINPIFESAFTGSWSVDFGGGTSYKATFEKRPDGFVLKETIVSSGANPSNLADEKRSEIVLEKLRDYTAFQVVFSTNKISALTKPTPHPVKDDFSKSWNYDVWNQKEFSTTFTEQNSSITTKIVVTLSMNTKILWEHHWVKTGKFKWSYKLKRFETTLTFSPSFTPSLQVRANGNVDKSWSKELFSTGQTKTFTVSGIPVVIVFQARLNAQTNTKMNGRMNIDASTTFGATAAVTVKYQNGWSFTPTYSVNYSNINFDANAKLNSENKGELPITFSAYLYDVAGPFLRLTPWIKSETNASMGGANQVGYTISGGVKASGGVEMAGWLKTLCGNVPSVSYTFWEWSRTLASGTKTF